MMMEMKVITCTMIVACMYMIFVFIDILLCSSPECDIIDEGMFTF